MIQKRGRKMKKTGKIILLLSMILFIFPWVAEAKLPLKVRDKDSQVKKVEEMLSKLGYEIRWVDQEFGYETLRAVKEFQANEKLPVTGVVDKRTWERLEKISKNTTKVQSDFRDDEQLKLKDKDPRVKILKQELVKMGYNIRWVDEEFSYETERAVKSFQKEKNLDETGIVDKNTWESLWGRGKPRILTQGGGFTINPKANMIVQEAKKYMGVPYVFGGATPAGFDCSGYIQYVFRKADHELPRTADYQFFKGTIVGRSNLREGDVVFFESYEPGPSHNGIYVGNGQFIHASSSRGVMISRLDESYWASRYLGARRMIN